MHETKEPVAKNCVERDSFLKLVYYLSQLSGRNSSIRMLSMVLNEELRLPTKYSDLKPKFWRSVPLLVLTLTSSLSLRYAQTQR